MNGMWLGVLRRRRIVFEREMGEIKKFLFIYLLKEYREKKDFWLYVVEVF